jgi:hypothetical protein
VNIAVYVVPLPEKLLSVPKVALTSSSANVVVDFVEVNVTVDVPPEFTEDGLATTVIVGAVVSILCAACVVTAEWVSVAALPAASTIVPVVFKDNVFTFKARPSTALSPATTGYENTSWVVPEPDA